jgi:hypothetical protein
MFIYYCAQTNQKSAIASILLATVIQKLSATNRCITVLMIMSNVIENHKICIIVPQTYIQCKYDCLWVNKDYLFIYFIYK